MFPVFTDREPSLRSILDFLTGLSGVVRVITFCCKFSHDTSGDLASWWPHYLGAEI